MEGARGEPERDVGQDLRPLAVAEADAIERDDGMDVVESGIHERLTISRPGCPTAERADRPMLITCPSCAATYDLPIERIGGAGRKVRCVSCHESWFVASPDQAAPDAAAKPSLDDDVRIEIVARPVPPPPPRSETATSPRDRGKGRSGKASSRVSASGLVKVAALLVVFAAPPSLVAFRDGIVSALPGTASLYRSVGLPVNLVGLSLAKVASHLSDENGTTILQVTGEIVNEGKIARSVPWLRISIEGEHGEPLYEWSAKAAEGELPVGRSAPFRVRLTAPPSSAHRVAVTFREGRARRTAALH